MILQPVNTTSAAINASILGWGAGKVGSSTTVRFLYPWYSESVAEVVESGISSSKNGELQHLRIRHIIPAGNGEIITYTLRVAGVDTGLSVDLASDQPYGEDISTIVSVSQGDLLSIKIEKALGIGASPRNIVATVDLL